MPQNNISFYPPGSYRSLETLEKFENFIFLAWKVMEFSTQSWKIKAVYMLD